MFLPDEQGILNLVRLAGDVPWQSNAANYGVMGIRFRACGAI